MARLPNSLVVAGPSGAGKGALLNFLKVEFKSLVTFSVSHTTREPRPGEIDGVHYHFVTVSEFESMIKNGDFLEHAIFSSNYYGTSLKELRRFQKSCRGVLVLEIDLHGVEQIKQIDDLQYTTKYLFIVPPSMQTLAARLRARGTETDGSLMQRLTTAENEMAKINNIHCDLKIVNDDLRTAWEQLKHWFEATFIESQQSQTTSDGQLTPVITDHNSSSAAP